MTRKLILFTALALLIWLVACGDDGDKYGGPYPINEDQRIDKAKTFKLFQELPDTEPLSETIELSKELLRDSIEWHRVRRENDSQQFNSPYGDNHQLYNYVITKQDVIIVARWVEQSDKSPVQINRVDAACNALVKNTDPGSDSSGNDNSRAREKLRTTGRFMVNFFPEDEKNQRVKVFLCDGSKKILDSLTKHFMLAQGLEANGDKVSNQSFKVNWETTEVAYAGEMIVDVKECVYTVTNGSGTYLRGKEQGPGGLKTVAERFEEEIGSFPAYQAFGGSMYSFDNDGILPKSLCTPSTQVPNKRWR